MADAGAVQRLDCAAGTAVEIPRRFVAQVVAEVGTDDDQGLRTTPKAFDHFGHLRRIAVADGQRHQGERIEHALQKR